MTLLYGMHPVLEALRAPAAKVERVCVERGLKNARLQEIIDISRQRNVPVSFEERAWLDRKSEGRRHQGVVCYLAEAALLEVEQVLESASSPGLLLILDGVEDPQNLGAILRSAEVAGADGVILPRWRSASISPAVVRVSAGAAAHIRIARSSNLSQLIDLLKKKGYWVVGFQAEAGRPIWEADFTVPTALVLGSEGSGIRRLVKERCDYLVSIPVRGKVVSYNVSVAAGIALYECVRQRRRISTGSSGF
jgi:23S rRNA (guanosine2251-2'-O)-methyltransferase